MKKRTKNTTRNLRNLIYVICIVAVAAIVSRGIYVFTKDLVQNILEQPSNISAIEIEIKKGATTKEIAALLFEKGLINSPLLFRMESRLKKFDTQFKEGTFTIRNNMNADEIMKIMSDSNQDLSQKHLLVKEGMTILEIANELESLDICSKEDFLLAVNEHYDYEFLKDIQTERRYLLEGYLYPDTYYLKTGTNASEIVRKMLDRFELVYQQNIEPKISTLSIDELITIASIIEAEAVLEEERAIISGVIYNRLKKNMKLEMCSTIQYALNKKTAVSLDDIKHPSLYNTYQQKGLPPSPIGNPGEKSIQAALNPKEHDFVFFVKTNKKSNEHFFTSDYQDFLKAKKKYKAD